MSALDQLLADLEALDERATPAPWAHTTPGRVRGPVESVAACWERLGSEETIEPDATLIVALRNAYPQLRDGIRALEAALAACQTSTRLALEERDAARADRAQMLEHLEQERARRRTAEAELELAQTERAELAERLADAEERLARAHDARAMEGAS
jgi:chromosome segregation ATPase